ncbi:MAG TPA: PBP1A family penicillin-binding protein [Gammaproteobacteria bacterium]|jgi:penicillin-binding protein 1A|nr:PBP1A family penicillin-binding protein [Gammaproteobacteria bacterium]
MKPYIKILLTISSAFAAMILALVAVFVGGYYYVAPSLPRAEELRDIRIQVPLQVYSRDGRLLAEFGEMKRTPVAYEDIPPLLIKAILAAEDEHFFEHPGVDYRGVIRGLLNELSPSGTTVGGSTITQQVTRTLNVLQRSGLSSGLQRFVQKFKEWILAFRIEREFTKQEILELYLNTYFFGQRSYGVATAARTYFGKDLAELTVSEVAILAGIPQRPADLNPIASPERAAARRSYVLRRMLETGAIDEQQYQTAMAEPVVARRFTSPNQVSAPYVAEMVRAEMIRRFGPAAYTAGLKVTTTIDSRLQMASNRAIHDTLMAYDERHGYRGPLAHVELPPPAPGGADRPLGSALADPERLRALLEDYPTLLDYEAGVVLHADDTSARVYFAARGEQTIDFDAVSWAAPFVTDDSVGAKPTTVAQVLHPGDIVRFRKIANDRWRLAQIPEVQGAFVSIDPFDGAIVALNGGFDFFLNNFNRATQSRRQPGSSFKPFVYSAGLDHGFTPATIVTDAPPDVGYQPALERVWKPENFGGKYHGDVRLRVALRESMNAVSIRLLQRVGVPTAVEHVRRFGFDATAVPENLSLALGAGGVAPVDLAAGYAVFANGGYRVNPYFIDRVALANGELIYAAEPHICPECNTPPPTPPPAVEPATPALVGDITELYPAQLAAPRVISPQNAYLMTDMLQDVVRAGTGERARIELKRGDLAGKTGTTNDGRDTWFVGFNADVVAAAWVGFDQDRPLGANEQGGFTAIPMWIAYMRAALTGKTEHMLPRPPGIVEYRINPTSGLIAGDGAPNSIFEKFDIDNVPDREPDSAASPFNAPGPGVTPSRSGEPIF